MLKAKRVEIGGHQYVIGQVPADVAFDIACVVMEWRGRLLEAGGGAAAAPAILDKLKDEAGDDDRVRRLVADYLSEQVAGVGRVHQTFARMYRDPEYRRVVWDRLFEACTCDNRPVLGEGWKLAYAGERLGELVRVHLLAVEHNCSGFLAEFNGQAAPMSSETGSAADSERGET